MTCRVLIVDDSSTTRTMLRRYLGDDPELEIVGAAPNGREAIDRLERYNPDVVLLDVEMPVLNGLETLPELLKLRPKLPVIMFSRLTDRGAAETIDALFLGAADYVLKPDSGAAFQECIAHELIPKLRACGGIVAAESSDRSPVPAEPLNKPDSIVSRTPGKEASTRVEILVIASSTGGPKALVELIQLLPVEMPVPTVIVQHMPPDFTTALAQRLDSLSPLTVREASSDQAVSAADVWLAAGNHHLVVHRGASGVRVQLNSGPPENSCRPAADVLFRSVAEEYGAGTLAVVLTGMGNDGLAGCGRIVERGGSVIVQDEASSAVWGMPGQVAKAGLAEAILPIEELGREISTRLARRRSS
jgi:two-component system chemotaxis response regulator CheB